MPDIRARWRREIEAHIPAIIERLAAEALAGDVSAAGLLLARCVPAVRPEAATVRVDLPEDATPAEIARRVLAAVAAGSLPHDAGRSIAETLAAVRTLETIDALAERVANLERSRSEHADDE